MEPPAHEDHPHEAPRRRSGCVWGCLSVVLVVVLGIAAVFGYSSWYLYKGFENDTRLQTIMAIVHHDPRTEAILGRNIKITEIESHTSVLMTGVGHTASYTLRLVGSDGEGELKADLDLNGGRTKVTLMILIGPDGRSYTLVGKEPKNPMQTIWNLPVGHPA